jgi:hypothetical protein
MNHAWSVFDLLFLHHKLYRKTGCLWQQKYELNRGLRKARSLQFLQGSIARVFC